MQVIEKNTQFEELKSLDGECYIVPIFIDSKKHRLNNSLSLLYLNCDNREFMLCFDHSESLGISLSYLDSLQFSKLYIPNKSDLNLKNMIDVSMLYYLNTNKVLEFDFASDTHNYFERKYYRFSNVNKLIPIYKHLENCRKIVQKMKRVVEVCTQDDVFDIYNNDVLDNLNFIESSGLKVDRNKIPVEYQRHIGTGDFVYTEYNPYTSTGRPSNKYGGMNFGALNKSDGSREPFISRFNNGILVEMDYDAYHLRLIAKIIDFDLPKTSVHEYMMKFYGIDDYEEAKRLSFQYLYGNIPENIIDTNPFFKSVQEYINSKWSEYKERQFVSSDIYKRRLFAKNLPNMNKNKLFNYLIQLSETENNLQVIQELNKYLEDKESKLVLYSYDSFLIDFNMNDGVETLKDCKRIVDRDGIFPVTLKRGDNYHDMK